MKKLGDLNFILEDLIDYLFDHENMNGNQFLNIIYKELQLYPHAQEEYNDGSHPVFKNIKTVQKIKAINKLKKFKSLIKKYVKEHDLQWGEVLYIVYGYLMIHRPDKNLIHFSYSV